MAAHPLALHAGAETPGSAAGRGGPRMRRAPPRPRRHRLVPTGPAPPERAPHASPPAVLAPPSNPPEVIMPAGRAWREREGAGRGRGSLRPSPGGGAAALWGGWGPAGLLQCPALDAAARAELS